MKFLAAALAALIISTSTAAYAGEIADNAAAAEKLLQSNDGSGAFAKFYDAQEALWKAMPLAVMNVRQVTSAGGFGIYSERPNHIYKPGDEIVLYMEPVGYGYGSDGLGNNQIALMSTSPCSARPARSWAPSKSSAASSSPRARITANCSSS